MGTNELILTKALRISEVLVIMKMLKLGLKAIFVEKVWIGLVRKYVDCWLARQFNDNYNFELPHFQDMAKWIVNIFFFVTESMYLAFTC